MSPSEWYEPIIGVIIHRDCSRVGSLPVFTVAGSPTMSNLIHRRCRRPTRPHPPPGSHLPCPLPAGGRRGGAPSRPGALCRRDPGPCARVACRPAPSTPGGCRNSGRSRGGGEWSIKRRPGTRQGPGRAHGAGPSGTAGRESGRTLDQYLHPSRLK